MEALNDFQWLFSLGPAGGFCALLWMSLKFFGASQKDATNAALELYQKVNARCDKCESELVEAKLNHQTALLENADLRARIAELERRLSHHITRNA